MKTGISQRQRHLLRRLAAGEEVRDGDLTKDIRHSCVTLWVPAGYVDVRAMGLRRSAYTANPHRIEKFREALERTYPGYRTDLPPVMSRVQAAKLQGHSKLAAAKDGVVLVRDFTRVLEDRYGKRDLLACRLSELESEELAPGLRILTVENLDSFLAVAPDKNGLPAFDLAVCTSGKPATRMLQWLGSLKEVSVTHYGDFDFTGVEIYQMVRRHLPEAACRLFKPHGLEAAFARQAALGKGVMGNDQLRPIAQCEEVAHILGLIAAHRGVGVEQQVFDPEE